jgi:hypothetical protein
MKMIAGLVLGAVALSSPAFAGDAFVARMEAMYGRPGSTHVVPQCQCTLQYLGTRKIAGRRGGRPVYSVLTR